MKKNILIHRLCFLILVLVPSISEAQLKELSKTGNLNISDGISGNCIRSIIRDTTGFMWFATPEGLSRYDGKRVRTYKTGAKKQGSISSDYVNSLFIDSKGAIWVATSHGLNKFDSKTCRFQIFLNEKANPNSISNNDIKFVFEDQKGFIWAGTANGLNKLVDSKKNRFERYLLNTGAGANPGISFTTAMCQDKNQLFWVATAGGLLNLSASGKLLRLYRHHPGNMQEENDDLTCLLWDKKDFLWIGSRAGTVSKFNIKSRNFTEVPLPISKEWSSRHVVNCITLDKAGNVWIGSFKGAYQINPRTNQILHYLNDPDVQTSISDNTVFSVFDDNYGTIWIGTYTNGVDLLGDRKNVFGNLRAGKSSTSLSFKTVNCIAPDLQNNLWIGTNGGGLNVKNGINGVVTKFSEKLVGSAFGSDQISSIFLTDDGKAWIGMFRGGISYFDPLTASWKSYRHNSADTTSLISDDVLSVCVDKSNRLWVATKEGLDLFDKGHFTHVNLKNKGKKQMVLSIFEDSKQNVWISSFSGIYRLKHNEKTFKQVPVYDNQNKAYKPDLEVFCVTEDAEGIIWAGTQKDGLKRYNVLKCRFETFSIKGLPEGEEVCNIRADKSNRLWLTSFHRLMLLNEERNRLMVYGKSDGMTAIDISYNSLVKGQNNTFYLGTNEGVLYFDADDVKLNELPPSVVFTDLEVQNVPIFPEDSTGLLKSDLGLTSEIVLSHKDNFLKVGFASLNYVRSEKNQFSYMLKGVDKFWHQSVEPSVIFNNLAPGDYTLIVNASNNDNVWSRYPRQLKITVLQPPWKRWWAILIYLSIIAGIGFLIIRLFWIKKEIRAKEELSRSKLDFFTNISHEIRTHLTLISGPLDKLVRMQKESDEVGNYLEMVQNNSKRLVALVTELLDFRKLDENKVMLKTKQYDVVSFLRDILPVFAHLSQQQQITLTLKSSNEKIFVWYDHFQVQKVIYNLLSNAFKFSDAGAQISIEVFENVNNVQIKITDDGKGIAADSLKNIFKNYFQVYEYGDKNTGYGLGLALSKKIVEMHHGTLGVESTPSTETLRGKTTFTTTFLKGNHHFSAENVLPEDYVSKLVNRTFIDPEMDQDLEKYDQESEELITVERKCVLLAEDNPELRRFIIQSLSENYTVIECYNGEDAWERASDIIPDVVISDILMGEMSGLKLCEKLKQDDRTNHIPVILLTAMATRENRIEGLIAQADHYITKPFEINELELTVKNLLNLQQAIQTKFGKSVSEIDFPRNKTGSRDDLFLGKLAAIIEENMSDPGFGVNQISINIGMSRPVVYRKLKALTGMSINEFSKNIRLKKAASILRTDSYNINEIAENVGFSDRRYFSREFRKVFSKTPSEYARTNL
ncbi:hybrid sensor histidine kinase/response regulator transcription factor [Dyadobacter diqingensis]|uniref:hybrid sensor histidine kinase/response regulator transcription factor n=1 Tax=Dyadobacter diqingensis TaxID=2938121 RepID=UPI0020C3965C|nr:hybrid sensor histidine kinase/response regulator transcription factor [Dyadobacter diqingensis]